MSANQGLFALKKVDLFNILCIPLFERARYSVAAMIGHRFVLWSHWGDTGSVVANLLPNHRVVLCSAASTVAMLDRGAKPGYSLGATKKTRQETGPVQRPRAALPACARVSGRIVPQRIGR
jgi:hypothetical protein